MRLRSNAGELSDEPLSGHSLLHFKKVPGSQSWKINPNIWIWVLLFGRFQSLWRVQAQLSHKRNWAQTFFFFLELVPIDEQSLSINLAQTQQESLAFSSIKVRWCGLKMPNAMVIRPLTFLHRVPWSKVLQDGQSQPHINKTEKSHRCMGNCGEQGQGSTLHPSHRQFSQRLPDLSQA